MNHTVLVATLVAVLLVSCSSSGVAGTGTILKNAFDVCRAQPWACTNLVVLHSCAK